jgi:hypothetical protein
LVTVTVLAALVVPATTPLNTTLIGVNVSGPAVPFTPLPVRLSTCGLNAVFDVTVTAPRIVPFTSGLNVTPAVHCFPAPSVLPHGAVPFPLTAYSPLPASPRLTVPPVLFTTVIVLAALVVPTFTLPKLSTPGFTVNGVTPFPLIPTTCGELLALSVIVTAPAIVPTKVGLNVTRIVQLPDGCTTTPVQLSVSP